MRVGVGVAAVCDQSARGGGPIALALLRFGAGDAFFDEAIVRIDLGRPPKSGKVSFVSAQREMELVEAAPKKQERREGNAERRSRQNASGKSACLARRSRRCFGCGS